jgi:ketosteroid isomerase-like protein
MSRIPLLAGVFLLACQQPTPPAAKPGTSTASPELSATIVALDSAMFSAFNAHDAELLATFFTADLEFYHDKGGLAGFDSTMAGFTRLFTQPETSNMRRDIVPGTLEVHPLGDFGLLESCQHRFCHTENGSEECGTFKNIMVWRKEGTSYKVSRVISYDH